MALCLWVWLGFGALAAPPKNVVLAVIAADKDQTYALAEGVRQVRDRYNIRKEQLPITRIPANKLTAQDFQRIGFNARSLPVIALMKVSSSQNLEGVLGNPPYIFRNVKQSLLPAQLLLCRWCELAELPIPAELQQVSNVFIPFRIFVLNTGESSAEVEATQRQLAQVKAEAGVSDRELPVLSTTHHDGLLDEEDYTRLGFLSDAFPIVCLVQMSESGNPSKIVGDGILRNSYNPRWSARQIVRLWARFTNRDLPSLPENGDLFSVEEADWSGRPVAGRPARYHCVATNYRYGVGGRFWLQVSGRITTADGTEVAPVPVTDFKVEASDSPATSYPISGEVLTPATPGRYLLHLDVRDKVGSVRTSVSLPLEL